MTATMSTAARTPMLTSVLLVEDDDVDIMTVQRAFKHHNILNPLHVAHDGVEALEMLRNGSIRAERRMVLLDLNMPRMNGIEFLKELRKDPELSSMPVVVLTTSAADPDRTDAYGLHVAGYMLKPVTFAGFCELMASLNRYWSLVEFP